MTAPRFFGASDRPLYGVHHPPESSVLRDTAVLLCAPGQPEYMAAHWALRRLATRLAEQGFHVLRFDYTGCGDSAGDAASGDVPAWCADVRLAADELRALAGVERLDLVGRRLGAALGLLAGVAAVRRAVLWDPVLRGAAYLRELRELEAVAAFWSRTPYPLEPDVLLGYPLPEAHAAGIAAIDLAQAPPEVEHLTVISSAPTPDETALLAACAARGVAADRVAVADETPKHPLDPLLPTLAIAAMVEALAQ